MSVNWSKWLQDSAQKWGGYYAPKSDVEILIDGTEFIPAMLEMIHSAKHHVGYQFFGLEADDGGLPFAEALMKAKSRGCDVKMTMDTLEMFMSTNGAWNFMPPRSLEVLQERADTRALVKTLEKNGIDIYKYGLKYLHRRTHAKSLVIDGEQCCIGGFNPTEHNARWHEVCAMATGPIVAEAEKEFNWLFEKDGRMGLPKPKTATSKSLRNGRSCEVGLFANKPIINHFALSKAILGSIEHATQSIWIENAYVAYPKLLQSLIDAKHRGVPSVNIIVPAQSNHAVVDKRFKKWIPRLKAAGVDVFFYQGMTHAKVMMVDDVLVSVGSANLEEFSMRFNSELNLWALDETGALAEDVHARLIQKDVQNSKRI